MKLKNAVKVIIVLFALCFYAIASADDPEKKAREAAAKAKEVADQAELLDKVLKEYEIRKQKEQDELAGKLNNALIEQINSWIDASRKDKDSKIGTRLQQSWEKLASTFKVAPIHYEYYLIGYKYTILKNEVLKTMSMTNIYKGDACIRENLYVEKYHSPNVSDTNPFFYTVTTDYSLNYEYKNGKFELVNTESEVTGFVNDLPIEIKKTKKII